MTFSESRAVTAVAAGATAYVGIRTGVLKSIPALGPATAPMITIVLGLVVATMLGGRGGTTGQAIEGIGIGLIVIGVSELGA